MPALVLDDELLKLNQFKKDIAWFQKYYTKLKEQYKGEYVAVHNENLIGHDKDANLLIERLKEQYGDISSFVVERIHESDVLYIL